MLSTKKEIIIAYCEQHGLGVAGPGEIHEIREAIHRAFGPEEKTSSSYIAQVLHQAGIAVRYTDRFFGPSMPEPYATRLKGALQFRDLSSAEACLQRVDQAYRTYAQASDRVGIRLVRALVLKGKQRALRLAYDSRVHSSKRGEKQEIALWFTVWLQTPDLFFAWLELRKQTGDFQRAFGAVQKQG
jgi:hypothetical protein